MDVFPTKFPEILHLRPRRFADVRGWFMESWAAHRYAAVGIKDPFVQDNLVQSPEANTIRGLHFQRPPSAQGKLVMALTGRILDVVVDIRKGSPQFGQSLAIELSAERGDQLWVPAGFAHGYCTLVPNVSVFYKVTAPYDPTSEGGLRFDDPALCISWPVTSERVILSDKDRALPNFSALSPAFIYGVDA